MCALLCFFFFDASMLNLLSHWSYQSILLRFTCALFFMQVAMLCFTWVSLLLCFHWPIYSYIV